MVDAGFSFTHALPIFDGQLLESGIRRINLGGKALTNYFKELISYRHVHCWSRLAMWVCLFQPRPTGVAYVHGQPLTLRFILLCRSINMMDESFLIETIKDAVCFVSQDALADLKLAHSRDSPHRSDYTLLQAFFEWRLLTTDIDWQCVLSSCHHNHALSWHTNQTVGDCFRREFVLPDGLSSSRGFLRDPTMSGAAPGERLRAERLAACCSAQPRCWRLRFEGRHSHVNERLLAQTRHDHLLQTSQESSCFASTTRDSWSLKLCLAQQT